MDLQVTPESTQKLDFAFTFAFLNSMAQPIICICIVTQTLRRAAFLERKKKLPLAEETALTGNDNNVCRQGGSDLLDKKVASYGQTAQKENETVDKDCPLNLNPTPSYPRESVESVETDDSIENVFDSKSNQVFINEKGNAGNSRKDPCSVPSYVCIDGFICLKE